MENEEEIRIKAKELMAIFFRAGTKDLSECAKLSLIACDEIINETLTEYTNDENHDRVVFYNDVKRWLNDFIALPTLEELTPTPITGGGNR